MNIREGLKSFFPELDNNDIDLFIEFIRTDIMGPISQVTNDADSAFLGEAILGIPDWTKQSREERASDDIAPVV